jgi:hypothetical protein
MRWNLKEQGATWSDGLAPAIGSHGRMMKAVNELNGMLVLAASAIGYHRAQQ